MFHRNRNARINIKLVVILLLVMVALGISLVAARQIRRTIRTKRALEAGNAAFENEKWLEASRQFQEYLDRNLNDVEILKKYAKARSAIRPIEVYHIEQTIAAYRRVMQLDPLYAEAYERLAKLYGAVGNFEELAYVARTKREHDPNDLQAPLWLASALIHLNKQAEAQQLLQEYTDRIKPLPDKRDEYVLACGLMSDMKSNEDTHLAKVDALDWLNKAAAHAPESAEALAYRAGFYRKATRSFTESEQLQVLRFSLQDANEAEISLDTVRDQLLTLARKDLEVIDDRALEVEDPRVRFFLGAEWIAHGEIERAEAQLQAAEDLPQETIEEYFLENKEWTIAHFLFASDLALRRGTESQDLSLADDILKALEKPGYRIRVLPAAIQLYVNGGRISDARNCLDEYTEIILTNKVTGEPKLRQIYLQALVAKAEDRLYVVIDAIRPILVNDASHPELWRLLAEAYSRTDQSRRAIGALVKYLRLRPNDSTMTLQLAKEYIKLQDWNKAFETASLAEPLDPSSIIIRLLRIESSIYLAAGQTNNVDTARLAELSKELALLREKHPKEVDIRILQAIIAVYLEQHETAEKELKDAILECDEPLEAKIQLIKHYYRAKRMEDAVSLCKAACKEHSEVAQPWLSQAGLHVANADYDSALHCLREGLEAVTGRWETRSISIQLALMELLHGDQDTGIALLDSVAAQDPQEIRARSLLLEIRKVQENRIKVEKLIEELKEAEGESGLYWRLHQATVWLSSEEWRSKQKDIHDQLQYCINSDPEWSAPVLLLVRMYEKLQDFKRVEEVCRQALSRNPSAVGVADALMTLLEKQGRFSDAEMVLEEIRTNPRVESAWNFRMALNTRNYTRAINELTARISGDDRDANSRILLARLIYWQDGDTDRAFDYLKQAEAITPGSMALTVAKVSILRAEGQTVEAQQILDEYVTKSKEFGAYMMRAEYYAGEGEFERAEQDYQKLIAFTERGVAGYLLLSNFYFSNDKLDKAVETLDGGLEKYPEDLSLKRRIMQFLLARGTSQDRVRAVEILTDLEKRMPQDPELMTLRAMQYLQEQTPQSFEAAKESLEEVVRLAPMAIDAQLLLISVVMELGQYEKARDYAIQALGSNPDNPALLSARSRVELALENTQMAARLARLPLQKDPNNTEARDTFVAVALKSEDPELLEESLALIESELNRTPSEEGLLISRAHVLTSLKQPQRAIPELEAYCRSKDGQSSIIALVTLADMYRLTGDISQAEKKIEQAEQLDPNNLSVIHARFLWMAAQNRMEDLIGMSSAYFSADKKNITVLLGAASILSASDMMEFKQIGLKLFEHAVSLSPMSVPARLGLASSLYQTGDAERAKVIYRELLNKYPDSIQMRVLNDLAWILQEKDHSYEAALELVEKGLSLATDDQERRHLLDTKGTILFNMEDRLTEARTVFETLEQLSLEDNTRRARTLLKLGRICAKLNDHDQAKSHIEKALEIDRKTNVFTEEERSEIKRML